jgi:Na+-transporting NADH:ubiquinone oxidoreductase subunit B
MIRKMLDRFEPMFKPGGKLEKLYPLYEANDTFLFTPGEVAHGGTHVRDALDTKRMMSMVIVALLPCIFMALYNTGYQAQVVLKSMADFEIPSWWNGGWFYGLRSHSPLHDSRGVVLLAGLHRHDGSWRVVRGDFFGHSQA